MKSAFDEKFVNDVVDKLKKQGLFDQFRKECLSDIDTRPAYQNLQTRVQVAVDRFLSTHKWTPQLKKNILRDSLRRHLNGLPMLSSGIDRVVDQVINPKFISNITPLIDMVTCEHLGINYDEWKKNRKEYNEKIAEAKIPSLLEIDTTVPSFGPLNSLSSFYRPQHTIPSQNSFNNLNFSHPNFNVPHFPPFNSYMMHSFGMDEKSFDSSNSWSCGPIHPDFGVPLPTMPYIPEPAPPLPQEESQQEEESQHHEDEIQQLEEENLEILQDQFVENPDIIINDHAEIAISNTEEIADEPHNRSYHFEWENYDDIAISDVSVSSVHTSDLSSLGYDDNNDNDKDIDAEIGAYNKNCIEQKEDLNTDAENSFSFQASDQTKKSNQKSKAQMKKERREQKINAKKKILWHKMNNSIGEFQDGNILIEEEFATVEEEIGNNENSALNFKGKIVGITSKGEDESRDKKINFTTGLQGDAAKEIYNLNETNDGICGIANNFASEDCKNSKINENDASNSMSICDTSGQGNNNIRNLVKGNVVVAEECVKEMDNIGILSSWTNGSNQKTIRVKNVTSKEEERDLLANYDIIDDISEDDDNDYDKKDNDLNSDDDDDVAERDSSQRLKYKESIGCASSSTSKNNKRDKFEQTSAAYFQSLRQNSTPGSTTSSNKKIGDANSGRRRNNSRRRRSRRRSLSRQRENSRSRHRCSRSGKGDRKDSSSKQRDDKYIPKLSRSDRANLRDRPRSDQADNLKSVNKYKDKYSASSKPHSADRKFKDKVRKNLEESSTINSHTTRSLKRIGDKNIFPDIKRIRR